jgi:hypothetical protein
METHKSTARDFFLHLLSTVTLYMAVISFLLVIFNIVDNYVPDALSQSYNLPREAIRTPFAILFVSFPVLAWSVWFIGRLLKREPAMKDFWVRKWLMYLTVFLAAIIMIITLITVVYNFLNGEFTLRFFFKIISVLLTSLGIFYYYLSRVKGVGNEKILKGIDVASIVLYVVSLSVAFMVMGSPADRRARRFDEDRVNDLNNIYYSVQSFFGENRVLPESINNILARLPSPVQSVINDPTSGAPYIYETTGTSTFKLCATFASPSDDRDVKTKVPAVSYQMYGNGYTDWSHEAGDYCFDRVIEQGFLGEIPSKL